VTSAHNLEKMATRIIGSLVKYTLLCFACLFLASSSVFAENCIKTIAPDCIIKNEKVKPTKLTDVSSVILQSFGVSPLKLDQAKFFAPQPNKSPSSSFLFVIDGTEINKSSGLNLNDEKQCPSPLQQSSPSDFAHFVETILTLPANEGSSHILEHIADSGTLPSRLAISYNKEASNALVGSFSPVRNTFGYAWSTKAEAYRNFLSNEYKIESLELSKNEIQQRGLAELVKYFCSSGECRLSENDKEIMLSANSSTAALSMEDASDFKFLSEVYEVNVALTTMPLNSKNNHFYMFAISTLPALNTDKQQVANKLLSAALSKWENLIMDKYPQEAVINIVTRSTQSIIAESLSMQSNSEEALKANTSDASAHGPNFVVFFHIFLWLAVFLVVTLWITVYLTATIDPDYSSIIFRTTDTRLKSH